VPQVTALEAANLAERCRSGMENVAVKVGAETIKFTASFGVSDSDGVGSSDAMIERSDRALFQVKNAGRNSVRVVAADAEEAARPPLG
jgi:PleD family two-component response regulator